MSPTDARRPPPTAGVSPGSPRPAAGARAGTGFWVIAAAFLTAMASTTVQTPLYPLYQRQQGFATFVITVIFAAFAAGVVAGLWLIGHISDSVGRRPMVLLGILLQIPAVLIDITWDGVPGLLTARVISGIGVGAMTAAAAAYLAELRAASHPGSQERTVTAVITVASIGGLALGPLIGGFLATWAPAPLTTPYAVFAVLLALAAAGTLLAPETVPRDMPRPPYRPQRFAMPQGSRAEFLGAAIAAFASFAIFGLFTSLAPTFVAGPMHEKSLLAVGLVTFSVFAAAALSQVSLSRLPARQQVIGAVAAIVLGLAAIGAGAVATSLAVFVAGGIIAGTGDGLLFGRALSTAAALAEPAKRGEVLGLLYLAAYTGLTIPALAIGAILKIAAPTATLIGFAVATAALAIIAGATLQQHTTDASIHPPSATRTASAPRC
jgi:MFS family permease